MFNKLKTILGLVKFQANARLEDGTELVVEGNLAEGTKVFVITGEGNIPLPDGTYTLDDGKMITVVDGAITDITEKPEEEPEPGEDEMEEPPAETPAEQPTDDVAAKIMDLESRLDKLEELVNSLSASQNEIKNQNEELQKQNELLSNEKIELTEKVNDFEIKLSKMDGAEPAKKANNLIGVSVELNENTSQILNAIQKHKKDAKKIIK